MTEKQNQSAVSSSIAWGGVVVVVAILALVAMMFLTDVRPDVF